jgi:hypothetical protein
LQDRADCAKETVPQPVWQVERLLSQVADLADEAAPPELLSISGIRLWLIGQVGQLANASAIHCFSPYPPYHSECEGQQGPAFACLSLAEEEHIALYVSTEISLRMSSCSRAQRILGNSQSAAFSGIDVTYWSQRSCGNGANSAPLLVGSPLCKCVARGVCAGAPRNAFREVEG